MSETASPARPPGARRRIWGWFFFDWASQPYNTLLLTFVFAPYMKELLGDGSRAQMVWGYGIGAAGLLIAVLAPLLGAVADRAGGRLAFVALFSVMYVLGAWGLWWAVAGDFNLWFVMGAFALGLIGMEFATIFTNALLPDLGTRDEIGRISGSGWAFGYVGGLVSLIFTLAFLAENAQGVTLIGSAPILGLDAAAREGTRAVGPLTALWYVVFMIPFFLFVRDRARPGRVSVGQAAREAWPELKSTLKGLPRNPSLAAYLASSMLYRDALNGIFFFGGIYAAGVLGWSIVQVGEFGILGATAGAIFAWAGGRADSRWGPKPVIVVTVIVLALVTLAVIQVSREAVFGMPVPPESHLPDVVFFALGGLIGAAAGALQSASRTMMVRQSDPAKSTESFGLYALAGKATAFIAPLSVGVATQVTGSQQAGIVPLFVLFLAGLVLLVWVKPEGAPPR